MFSMLKVDLPHHQLEPKTVREDKRFFILHCVVVMDEFVDENLAYCRLIPVDLGVELDMCRIAAGTSSVRIDGSSHRHMGARVGECLEGAGSESVVEILRV